MRGARTIHGMSPLRRSSLRASALLTAGALSLHELRYVAGWGSGAEQALAHQGHDYLSYAMPIAVALVAAGLAQLLLRFANVRSQPQASRGMAGCWLGASAALLAIYVSQEVVEGLLGGGHPGGVAGVFGNGGLVAVPLALTIGALIALAERGARAARAAPSRLGPAWLDVLWPAPARPSLTTPPRPGAAAGELALRLSGRAPPPSFR